MSEGSKIFPPQEDLLFAMLRFNAQMELMFHSRTEVSFALEHSRDALVGRSEEMWRQLHTKGKLGEAVLDLEDLVGSRILGEWGAEFSVKTSNARLDAAAIVFAHSLLDIVLHKYCEISFRIEPSAWIDLVRERQIKVRSLLEKGASAALEEIASDYVSQLERESLGAKIDRLHTVCKPSPKANYVESFVFSSTELTDFDETRHQIIHGTKFSDVTSRTGQFLEFALKAGVYFGKMVAARHSLNLKDQMDRMRPRLAEVL